MNFFGFLYRRCAARCVLHKFVSSYACKAKDVSRELPGSVAPTAHPPPALRALAPPCCPDLNKSYMTARDRFFLWVYVPRFRKRGGRGGGGVRAGGRPVEGSVLCQPKVAGVTVDPGKGNRAKAVGKNKLMYRDPVASCRLYHCCMYEHGGSDC